MSSPENVIIKEPGRFFDQPAWVEDYYNTVLTGGAGYRSHMFAYGAVTDTIRHRHNFPPEARGLVLHFQEPADPENGPVSGFVLDPEEFERFTEFVQNGYRMNEKNNWVLMDDIVAAIVHNDLFDSSNKSLDEIYRIIREAVYRARPNSGPDDIWIDAVTDGLHNSNLVKPDVTWDKLKGFFTERFNNLVYGHHPKPEPTGNFVDALAAELSRRGYAPPVDQVQPDLREIIQETAAHHPYTPWMKEPTPSPMRKAEETVRAVKDDLYNLGYIIHKHHNDPQLDKLLERAVLRSGA